MGRIRSETSSSLGVTINCDIDLYLYINFRSVYYATMTSSTPLCMINLFLLATNRENLTVNSNKIVMCDETMI